MSKLFGICIMILPYIIGLVAFDTLYGGNASASLFLGFFGPLIFGIFELLADVFCCINTKLDMNLRAGAR